MDFLHGVLLSFAVASALICIANFFLDRGGAREKESLMKYVEFLSNKLIEQNNKLISIEIVLIRMLDNACPEITRNIKIMVDIIKKDLSKEEPEVAEKKEVEK